MRNYLAVVVVLSLLLLPMVQPFAVSASPNHVGQVVAEIASLPYAQGNSCQGVIDAVQGGGVVERYMNQGLGTDFQPITVSADQCKLLVTFVPIVGSYNDLIVAARQYNPIDPASVRSFYVKAFLLAAEVAVVGIALDGVLYKAAFRSTAVLNDELRLGKLQSVCGDVCYSDALSSVYWFIKGTASGLLDDFVSWAGAFIPAGVLPPLPPICSVPILGDILRFFHWLGCSR